MKSQRNRVPRRVYPAAADWLEKANEDLAFTRAGFRETEHHALVLFHCQQVAEKALKGYLTHVGKRFGKIHFLTTLLKLATEVDPTFRRFEDECRSLDKYYIVTRYPVDWTASYSRDEAKRGLAQATEVLEFAEEKIAEKPSP